jgi:hypothetical protein
MPEGSRWSGPRCMTFPSSSFPSSRQAWYNRVDCGKARAGLTERVLDDSLERLADESWLASKIHPREQDRWARARVR